MKKRFICALLTLIMLVSLVPVSAVTASAAGHSVSESAITVLKQWNGYRTNCKADGYTGYGTPCQIKAAHGKGTHTISEKQADAALRAVLADLDKAVNTFASNAGISLTQGQHDALVLFSFDNGTAWMTGTGSFRSAVVNGLTGNEFLTAICWWNASTADDNRRKVEANMYLNGVYSSQAPSRYITVEYVVGSYTSEVKVPKSEIPSKDTKIPVADLTAEELDWYKAQGYQIKGNNVIIPSELSYYEAQAAIPGSGISISGDYVIMPGVSYEGSLAQAQYRYYDTATNPQVDVIPTMPNHKFMGWYSDPWNNTDGESHRVTALKYSRTVYAYWQSFDVVPSIGNTASGTVNYITKVSKAALYDAPNGKEIKYTVKGNVTIDGEYIDETGMRWGRVAHAQELYRDRDGKLIATDKYAPLVSKYPSVWIQLGKVSHYDGLGEKPAGGFDIDVTVTVTNDYVRIRTEDSIYSKEQRRALRGEQLRIVNTSSNDGFLWGQIANSDDKCIGWVALMYTNFEEVKNQFSKPVYDKVIGNATVIKPENGYVNLRSGAGTDNQIVGALAYKTRVPLYEITYVNGIRWGRTDSGWFSLAYAEVDGIDVDDYTSNSKVLAYAFVGDIVNTWEIHEGPSDDSALVRIKPEFNPYNRVITNLTLDNDGSTWGKIEEGWVKVSYADTTAASVVLKLARYQVTAETVTVRETPSYSALRKDTLVKGVEFNVNVNNSQIIVVGDSIWAKAFKVGEDNPTYMGWVNLAESSVSRVDAPAAETTEEEEDHYTGMMATVINADNVNVRKYNDATYAKIGSLPRGTTVAIWEEDDGWYKVDSNRDGDYDYKEDGWVSGYYLDIYEAEDTTTGGTGTTGTGTGAVKTGLGVIANTYTGVNVRIGAGTGYAANGKILAGSTVEILEVKTVGSADWGRVTQGWICMDYVTMVSYYPVAGATTSGTTGTTGGTSSSTNTTATEVVIFTGVISKDGTEVCTEPSIMAMKSNNADIQNVRTVNKGTPVTVHELLVVEETVETVDENNPDVTTSTTTKYYWARTNDGYIKDPGKCITLDPLAEKTYTVTSYVNTTDNCLRIYEANCADKKETLTLNKYDQVSVTTLKIVNNELWCRVEFTDEEGFNHEGYVKMKYLTNGVVSRPSSGSSNSTGSNGTTGNNGTTGSTGNTGNSAAGNVVIGSTGNTANQGSNGYVNNTAGYRYKGTVIRTGSLNVRALPSQTAALTTTMSGGQAMVIYETTVSEGMAWGRCDAGWVYLYYVDLQPCNNAVDAKVVYNENTIAYSDANCTTPTGTYARMSVVDIYEIVGNMARCDLGWVHMDNLG